MNISKHTFSFAIFSGKISIIFCVYLHRDVQPVWNKYRLAGTNDSHQPEHEDSNFPARLSSIVGEEVWCGWWVQACVGFTCFIFIQSLHPPAAQW